MSELADPRADDGAPVFADWGELVVAEAFDRAGLRWRYEPRTFPLEIDAEGRWRAAFTPDFYLPDLDLYVEVTTQPHRRAWRKRRKLRLLAERFPGVRVTLLERVDVEELAAIERALAVA